ncbi:membrane dipeptidase [Rhodococcoides trifolii]|uniref:Membrane dipeptidase n=1 Tax=Rhodococcoides trifolii TaxID=908250 RepID=A0A917FT81_9NOCA|nr:dipeptidase [Rhodococcus trifolii]GGF99866.1 membrane dipeptidase [Rhodococcus trifolii]
MQAIVDGHNDLAWAIRQDYGSNLDAVDLAGSVPELHTDLPRLKVGGVSGQFWSVYVSPDTYSGPSAVTATLEQIDLVRRFVARFPDELVLATTADEVESSGHRIASLVGMEGGHCIDGSLAVLRMMYALGVRYLTLTHNKNVAWADSATDVPVLNGLSEFGESVVREMNRLGMLVDLSHVSADVMRHALRVSSAPVIFSHSSARALCDHPRNVPDDVLTALADNGGICMVTFLPAFVSPAVRAWHADATATATLRNISKRTPEYSALMAELEERSPQPSATLSQVVEHIEHVRDVAGIDHVGIGGDYMGGEPMPEDLEDVSRYPMLFAALAGRGWSETELDKLAGANILRVLRAAEGVADAFSTDAVRNATRRSDTASNSACPPVAVCRNRSEQVNL